MAKASEYEIQLCQRLLDGDETASSEVCTNFLVSLVEHFKKIYSSDPRCDQDLINDAVTDSLLKFLDEPRKFDPERSTLANYLKMSAEGDIRNLLDKKKRKLMLVKNKLGERVELQADSRNSIDEKVSNPEQSLINKEIEQRLHEVFENEEDYELAHLILSNIRETRQFAKVLGIVDLPKEEQRKRVKRAKDRIKAKLKRAANLKQFWE